MRSTNYKPLSILVTVLMLFSLACNFSAGSSTPTAEPKPVATDVPKKEATEVPTKAAKEDPTKAVKEPTNTSGAVATRDDVKNATIQIQAEGTFVDPQVGLVVNGAGRGSGFIIDPSGIAVTNNHVVTGSALLKVWIGGDQSKTYSATVLGASECSDLAVIKIEGADFPYLQWHDGAPKVGLEVYTAGFPLGDPEYTMTKGIVSKEKANGKTSWASVGSVLEHDARINPGNSGGPLVDTNGKVVGINYSSITSSGQYFAIARAEADAVINQLKGGKDVTSIGVNGQIVMTEDKKISGVWVSSVKSGSPADKAGLKPGDIITQMEGLVLGTDGTMADYCQILHSHKTTDALSLVVLRWAEKQILEGQLNGRELKVTATYGDNTNNGSNGNDGGNTNSNGTTTVADKSNVITMDVPNSWQYNGDAWNDKWSIGGASYPFEAQTLTGSPDVKAYGAGWDTTGIFVATSRDWGSIGGYANLLEGVQDFYSDCKSGGRDNYKSDNYEGMIQYYTNCGPSKGKAIVLSLRPRVKQSSYLVLVEMKYATDAEFNELNTIFGTIHVTP